MEPKVCYLCPSRPLPSTLVQKVDGLVLHDNNLFGDGSKFQQIVVPVSTLIVPTVVVERVAPTTRAPSYMNNAIRVLPALPLQPVVLKRRGIPVMIRIFLKWFWHAFFDC